jgi:zeta-carotene desaturase
MNAKKEVLIIGGGFAGLAAGVELASRGYPVTVIERRGHLGGRAYSYKDPMTGSVLDNGQHVFMGCYRETLAFLEKIGTGDRIAFQKNLAVDFAAPGEKCRFQTLPLPAPFHLASGFLFFKGLTLRERLRVLQFGRSFQKGGNGFSPERLDRKTIPEWLNEAGLSEKVQERFWNPFALAALNDRPEVSSAALFSAVLKEALFSGRKGGRIGIATVGLSDLYTEAARDYIERKGGHFLIKTPVVKLHFRGREFQEAELEGGRRISAEALLVAVPFTALRRMLPDEMLYGDPFFAPLAHLQNSPIVAINLWFDREITPKPFVGFWGTKVHWLFNKGRLLKEGPPYLSLVISGAREELKTPAPQLIETAMDELTKIFPEAGKGRLVRSLVSKEPEATFAPTVGISKWRLPQKTPYRNFFLAGDWTDTGLPATIEGAVRSAKKAVELIEREG